MVYASFSRGEKTRNDACEVKLCN